MAEPLIDWCSAELVPALQEFLDTHWQQGHVLGRDVELLRWQHRLPQDGGRLSVLTACDEGRLLGIIGIIRFGFCLRGQRLQGAWLTTWLSAPEARRSGVGLRLLKRVLADGYAFVGTLGGNASAQQILGSLGFVTWDSIPRWIRVITPSALASLRPEEATALGPEAWAGMASVHGRQVTHGESVLRTVPWDDGVATRWDQAWLEHFAPRLVGAWRDSSHLRWRYVDHPRFRYVLRFAENPHTGRLVGLVVYRVEKVLDRTEKVMRVVDFLGDEDAASVLGADLVKAGESDGVAFADFHCTSSAVGRSIEIAGFVPERSLPAGLPRLFQPLDQSRTALTGAFWLSPALTNAPAVSAGSSDLYFTGADCDQDRPN